MSVSDLIDPIPAHNGPMSLGGAESWMQGRTLYGGASALIAYTHAVRCLPDLPPLRAGQVGFVAPLGGEMDLETNIIRRGRSVAQIRTEIRSEGQVALTAFWLFGAGRESTADHPAQLPSPVPRSPDDAAEADTARAPAFLRNNYEVRHTTHRPEIGEPVLQRWVRLKERGTLSGTQEAILMGDTLPPSAVRLMQKMAPISSINWSFNMLTPAPATTEGWWLAENASDQAAQGYSSERLRLYNADGTQMLSGIQCVAVFG